MKDLKFVLTRVIVFLLVSVLSIALLAGCVDKTEKTDETTAQTEEETKVGEETLQGSLISKDPLTLTVHLHSQDKNCYNEDAAVPLKAFELTNVKLVGVAPETGAKSIEVYNLMIASGELADIIGIPFIGAPEMFIRDAEDGVYAPLNDLIDEYAPNIKKIMDENPDVRNYMSGSDGQVYGIPYFYDLNAPEGKGWFIRTDWLEKLNLESPTNVDEYYEVLKAFKNNDLNENGEEDEVPFFSRQIHLQDLYVLWNARRDFYPENGTIGYGPYAPEYKVAITNIAKWYSEGIIDPEIFTAGPSSRETQLSMNKGGSTFDWLASTSSYNKLKGEIPGFEFAPMAPPAGIDGVVRNDFKRDKIVNIFGWSISSQNKNPVETIKYFDFWFSEQGKMLSNFGIEGEDYTIVNGDPVYTDSVMNADVPPATYLFGRGSQNVHTGTMQDIRYELQVMHPIGRQGYDLYAANSWGVEWMPLLTFEKEENERISTIMASVNTYVAEMAQKWILGAESIENTYEEYLSKLKEFGIEEAIKIKQDAYDRVYKNK